MAFLGCELRVLTEKDKEQTRNVCATWGSEGLALSLLGEKQEYELVEANLGVQGVYHPLRAGFPGDRLTWAWVTCKARAPKG